MRISKKGLNMVCMYRAIKYKMSSIVLFFNFNVIFHFSKEKKAKETKKEKPPSAKKGKG